MFCFVELSSVCDDLLGSGEGSQLVCGSVVEVVFFSRLCNIHKSEIVLDFTLVLS